MKSALRWIWSWTAVRLSRLRYRCDPVWFPSGSGPSPPSAAAQARCPTTTRWRRSRRRSAESGVTAELAESRDHRAARPVVHGESQLVAVTGQPHQHPHGRAPVPAGPSAGPRPPPVAGDCCDDSCGDRREHGAPINPHACHGSSVQPIRFCAFASRLLENGCTVGLERWGVS